jgi:hypothetical protein
LLFASASSPCFSIGPARPLPIRATYALVSKRLIGADEQKLQNRFLVGASIIGTIVWGFGGFFVDQILKLGSH